MKSKFPSSYAWKTTLFVALLAILISGCQPATGVPTIVPTAAPSGPFMAMDPPPDSDKPLPVPAGDQSCWMHNAANMLAGAGYGNGTTVQARSDDIFANMNTQYGTANGGWPSAAMQWWLASPHNTWTNNPYTVVTTYGNTNCAPWANANGAMDLGNELRQANMAGIAIRWPQTGTGCSGGHAITPWGDDNTSIQQLTANPGGVRVTDSDTDNGGDVQAYTYDAYTNPNPGGPNEGNGWYFNAYGGNHPYIIDIVTLSPTIGPSGPDSVRVTGCYQIQQTSEQEASDLHYRVGTDVDILSYRTWLDWTEGPPTITENQPRRELIVDWDLSGNKIPKGTWVTICTEFIESNWNSISYQEVHFTYPDGMATKFPDLAWTMETPIIDKAEAIPNVTGGYVIGNFDIYDSNASISTEPVARYRFVHQYLYNQSPESHTFQLTGTPGFVFANSRFTHSYGYPTLLELWRLEKFMSLGSDLGIEQIILGDRPVIIPINWKGRLPYPEGLN
jgi:hypothetical protein